MNHLGATPGTARCPTDIGRLIDEIRRLRGEWMWAADPIDVFLCTSLLWDVEQRLRAAAEEKS
jgi:hypothetical protein